ncbi:piggyBac transposable element-derived protein 3-like [Anarrhichthys ocellatus]|uniref:piggyBac transposable element-derived protein 3-like n=1 Tax=Anarrhichthys ocellatus TaxID=433405 RepID=UPI0012EE90F4|nr:piggyBac transposable element-derived protein 3-like [Anarrhichthys ocellatus]
MQVSARDFYAKKRQTVVVPALPAISDDDEEEGDDDDVADPDFVLTTDNQDIPGPSNMGPSAKRKRRQPAVEVLQDSDSEDDDDEQPAPQAQRPCKSSKSADGSTTWHKVDINNTALPEYQHSPPDYIETPFQYFTRYFDAKIIRHITHQTNLYAAQKDINTIFNTNEKEMMTFVGILIFMGVVLLPAVEDYWAMETRVPQVANLMSSKRFKLLKRVVHFCDNTKIPGTSDRFFKVRPLFSFLTTAFLLEPQTPKQSVDEVMVAYKGKTAGNLRQCIKSKPHKWGFKLFARASEDGFIHDMVLYQGKTTLEGHDASLTPEQKALGATSQIVSVLASSMSSLTTTAIFADNFFSSLELVRYLRDHNCRYTGTARDNRIRKQTLKAVKEMEKKTVPRGTCDYVTSDEGILAIRWKDNKTVTLLSTDVGVEPMSSVMRYCRETNTKEPVSCPAVIRSYNANMGGH